ncbi:MAG: aspartate/glutamate racemase family protein [Hyphomicrobiaceae bacterium]|nr:aspartate/glutamate racemase family protein [Hyphomicrobiaceae bacterium]
MHIGLIGGIGPSATEFYYRGLTRAHASAQKRMELTIVHADMGDLLHNATHGAKTEQARIYLELVKRLEAAGAEAVAITSMGGHFCVRELEEISPLPVINAIPVLDQYLAENGIKRAGLIGTRFVMETGVYGGVSAAEFALPPGDDRPRVHDTYIAIASSGSATDEQRAYLFEIGKKLCSEQGAETVILGGTDLFLAFEGQDCGFPVIDAAEVHIAALYRASVGSA